MQYKNYYYEENIFDCDHLSFFNDVCFLSEMKLFVKTIQFV